MKRLSLIVTMVGLFALGAYQLRAMPPQDAGTTAKQDAKDAGHDTKNAAKKTGSAVKKGSKKVANTSAKGVKKGAQKTEQGAGKVVDKTQELIRCGSQLRLRYELKVTS